MMGGCPLTSYVAFTIIYKIVERMINRLIRCAPIKNFEIGINIRPLLLFIHFLPFKVMKDAEFKN